MALGRNRTLATLVGGERSHHCAITAPSVTWKGRLMVNSNSDKLCLLVLLYFF